MRRPARSAPRQPDRSGSARGITRGTNSPFAHRGGTATASAADISALLQAAVGQHQAGQLAEAERLYRQVLAVDAEQPDALHLIGVLAYQVGRSDMAVPLIGRAIAHRPNAPGFRLNLGNALLALGQIEAAVEAYRQAAMLQPENADAHYNLGNALLQQDSTAAGISSLRRALQLRPDHPEAHYNLGNALRADGQPEEAIAAYQAALRLRPTFVDAQANLGMLLHEQGRHDEARPHFEAALTLQPEHQLALRGLASIEQTYQHHAEAARLLTRLAQLAPDDLQVHEHLIRTLLASDQPDAALTATVAGLKHFPADRQLLRRLVEVLQRATAPVEGAVADVVRAGLLATVTDDTFDIQQLATPIYRLVMAAPEYPALLAAVRAGTDPLAAGLALPHSLTHEPAVLAALPRVTICTPDAELILTAIRRSVLLRGETASDLPVSFLCALAGAAFLSEHAWLVQPDETARLDTLHTELADALSDVLADPAELSALEPRLLLAALYGRIGLLPGAERLAAVPETSWSTPFVRVIREQVLEPLEERRLAYSLPSITPIDDDVSQAVQAMYEENPYPRWRAARFRAAEPALVRFRALCPGEPEPDWPSPLPVLVAGVGTGQHPIQTAMRLPDATVLGIDLSRTSLGYGARMAAKLGIPNLRLAQADILALDALGERFALIECAGVLHHLANPMAGWAVLRRLLRPDGLMMVALYSERARAGVVAAREMIAAQNIPSTPDGIRAARRQIIDLPPEHQAARIVGFWDFYSQSGFRDLVMHVQEHRYTPLLLQACLDALGLRFLGFDVPLAVREAFCARFPQPGALLDLGAWDQFEAEHPDTFASMFHLWLQAR